MYQQHNQRQGEIGRQHEFGGANDFVVLVNQGNKHAIDVDHSKTENNTDLLVYPKHTPVAANQQWRMEAAGSGKCMIVSALNPNFVIDVTGAKAKSGTKCILYSKSGATNQLWEFQGNVIHSALGHDLVLAQHGGDHGSLIVETRNGKPNQSWDQVRN